MEVDLVNGLRGCSWDSEELRRTGGVSLWSVEAASLSRVWSMLGSCYQLYVEARLLLVHSVCWMRLVDSARAVKTALIVQHRCVILLTRAVGSSKQGPTTDCE